MKNSSGIQTRKYPAEVDKNRKRKSIHDDLCACPTAHSKDSEVQGQMKDKCWSEIYDSELSITQVVIHVSVLFEPSERLGERSHVTHHWCAIGSRGS